MKMKWIFALIPNRDEPNWQLCVQKKRVVTPEQNEKYYQAGALHSGNGSESYLVYCRP